MSKGQYPVSEAASSHRGNVLQTPSTAYLQGGFPNPSHSIQEHKRSGFSGLGEDFLVQLNQAAMKPDEDQTMIIHEDSGEEGPGTILS